MKIGVVTFPGSLDDVDAARAVGLGGQEAVALWHGDAGYADSDAAKPGARHRLLMSDAGWRYERTPEP